MRKHVLSEFERGIRIKVRFGHVENLRQMKLQAAHNDKAERLARGMLEAHRNKEYQTRSNPLKKETP